MFQVPTEFQDPRVDEIHSKAGCRRLQNFNTSAIMGLEKKEHEKGQKAG